MPSEKTKEVCIKAGMSLDKQLQALNNFLLNLCYLPDKDLFLFKQKIETACTKNPCALNTLLTDFKALPKRHKFCVSKPDTLFEYMQVAPVKDYLFPVVGNIERTGYLFNKDLILGLELNLPKHKLCIRYRLDFDPRSEKGLHLNVDVHINGTMYPVAITQLNLNLNLVTRFFVDKVATGRYGEKILGSKQMDTQQGMILFKFFIKMTLAALARKVHPKLVDNLFVKQLESRSQHKNISESLINPEVRKRITADLVAYYDAQRKDPQFKNIDIPLLDVDSEMSVGSESPSP